MSYRSFLHLLSSLHSEEMITRNEEMRRNEEVKEGVEGAGEERRWREEGKRGEMNREEEEE